MFLAVVPAYNEEKTIGSVARSLFNQVDKVVVVDDCSSDQTAEIAQAEGAIVLRHKLNRGQGAALQTGHDFAIQLGADYVLDFDADGQFNVEDIEPALAALKKAQADILFGSRFLDSRTKLPWRKKYFVLPLAKFFNHFFAGVKLTDAHNGFRIFNSKALQKIRITQDRMAHNTEIPAQVKKHNLKYIEFPVQVVYREYGQGIGVGVKIIRDLFIGRFAK